MSEFALALRPALADAPRGDFGRQPTTLALTAPATGHVILALAEPAAGDLAARLTVLAGGSALAVRPAGLGQWLMIGADALTPAAIAALEAGLDGAAVLVDQSHGRVRMALAGPQIEPALAKGVGIDLALAACPVGHTAQTLLGPIPVQMTRTEVDRFEFVVMRSFAVNLWGELITLAREFGVSADPA